MKGNQKASGAKRHLDRKNFKTNKKCRMCGSKDLVLWLDLGDQPLANSFIREKDLSKSEPVYPLKVFVCRNCYLSQLIHVVKPEVLFRNYVYFSSSMPKVSEHWRAYAQEVRDRFATSPEDFVVELGSNDGVLLGEIQRLGVRVLGIDPAKNIAEVANKRGIPTLAEFFSSKLAAKVKRQHGRAKTVIGNNVIAHIDDHDDLLSGVSDLLDEDGVFVFEAPYLVDMFDQLSFDTVYHEHLSYFSLRPIKKWLARYGLEPFFVRVLPIQGNSLRVYAGRIGRRPIDPSVGKLLDLEKSMGMHTISAYRRLAKKVRDLKEHVLETIAKLKEKGHTIGAYGAPAKGNTLLNYFGIGTEHVDFATEELPTKIGSYSPGMRIPVVHIDEGRARKPDYFLMLAWNYQKAILAKEEEYLKNGGKFIMPIGKMRILYKK